MEAESWRATLAAGDTAAAWDQFIDRYRGLILAVITRTASQSDDADEIFADVCGELASDDLSRLSKHADNGRARFSTWLATVVRNLTIDSLRRRDGRPRIARPQGLSELQREIFDRIVRDRYSHVEAYELVRQHLGTELAFPTFVREVKALFEIMEAGNRRTLGQYFPGPPSAIEQDPQSADAALVSNELSSKVETALQRLAPDERLAVKLFVVDDVSAAQVARIVGWPNEKAVYNRVYRSLSVLRRELALLGIASKHD